MSRLAFVAFLAIGSAVSAADAEGVKHDAWRQFYAEAHRKCPSHHLDLFTDGVWIELIADRKGPILPTVSFETNSQIDKFADAKKACAAETGGFSCETDRYLGAISRLKLIPKFARYVCRTWRCEEAGICNRADSK